MMGLPYVAEINFYSVPFVKPEITADRLIMICLPEETEAIKGILESGACAFELWDMTENRRPRS